MPPGPIQMDPSPCGAIKTHPDRPTPEPFHHEMGSDPHRDWDQLWQWDGEVKPTPHGLLPAGWSKEKWKQRCPSQKQSALVPAWSLEGGFVFMPSFGTQNYARTQTLCPGDSGEVRMWGFGGNILHGLGLLLCSSSGNEGGHTAPWSSAAGGSVGTAGKPVVPTGHG